MEIEKIARGLRDVKAHVSWLGLQGVRYKARNIEKDLNREREKRGNLIQKGSLERMIKEN